MKVSQFFLTTVFAALFFMSSSDAACICVNHTAGKHCGQSRLLSGCKYDYIYQCNGVYGSPAYEYGPCRKGCIQESISRDHCRL
ncbi:hypothetical protein BX616_008950 [Lobosporangium transversale]|uniref:Secreted protein n=1 Tax=Lobosporangium transversale TaxID=64571 RepID=A0A1Y2FXZ5_9FUNG|nr:hypothetical protein BCR41DRAFT_366203 [Lobosporangium transversale]KAF9914109.1 hypothetical protein BX616_008950 [Lobosporangium transversale]ORY88914.1 hypothetical protein BCR41DRAFT_366203 [Lobosporangium transversale]|eukprot:XP_021875022.1 hypothetical protein BCR41DRAFT_366203 [Lobosporangium transversale]